jgi:hypothetical protein
MDTLIIFDWDDTLFPSCMEKPLDDGDALDTISTSVIRVLTEAQKYGTVMIITNAEKGWVEESCRRYMPRCVSILETIVVLSARTTYEWIFEDSPYTWKAFAFQIASINFSQVLSIGDRDMERYATLKLDPAIRAKSIKLEEFPTTDTIIQQLDKLTLLLSDILAHEGDIDIRLRDLKPPSK